MGLYVSFSGATCAALRDVKRRPSAENARLALISIAITHTKKISDALARGGTTYPNMPLHTGDCPQELSIYHFPS